MTKQDRNWYRERDKLIAKYGRIPNAMELSYLGYSDWPSKDLARFWGMRVPTDEKLMAFFDMVLGLFVCWLIFISLYGAG